MSPILHAFLALLSGAAQPPQFHVLPPSSLTGFAGQEDSSSLPVLNIVRSRCREAATGDEIVVCGRSDDPLYGPAADDPEWARRYARRPEGPSAGIHAPATAMDDSRCATVRCAPRPLIGIFRRRF